MEKDSEISRSQDGRNPSQKPKPQKPDGPVLDSGWSGFLRIDKVRLGFEI
jgi:hypothetical protein